MSEALEQNFGYESTEGGGKVQHCAEVFFILFFVAYIKHFISLVLKANVAENEMFIFKHLGRGPQAEQMFILFHI